MDGGHAGTGISIAEGLALARDRRGGHEHIAVVVGDAALMSGLSLEALNDIGQRKTRLIILLNDNEMSISPTVGAVSQYLSRIKLSRHWRGSRRRWDAAVARIPRFGPGLLEWSRRLRHAVVDLSQPGRLFEDLGVTYVGPVPGHDLVALERTLRLALLEEDAPIIVHVRTRKGFGYHPAEADKVSYHGAALPPMSVPAQARPAPASPRMDGGGAPAPSAGPATARSLGDRTPTDGDAAPSAGERASGLGRIPNYTAVMAAELVRMAAEDDRIVAITAGMPTGTGVATFGERYPDRTFDVGIAEQHAMTLATGLAIAGQRPFVALYSTFLQRAFDQVVHDVCQNDVPVVIGIDRPGLVGEDGTSHQGMFTLSALRQLPNLVMAAPPRRAGAPSAAADRVRPGPSLRHPVSRATPASTCRRRSSHAGPGRPRRDAAERHGHPHRRLRAHRGAGPRGGRQPARRRAGRWASSTHASSSRSTRTSSSAARAGPGSS